MPSGWLSGTILKAIAAKGKPKFIGGSESCRHPEFYTFLCFHLNDACKRFWEACLKERKKKGYQEAPVHFPWCSVRSNSRGQHLGEVPSSLPCIPRHTFSFFLHSRQCTACEKKDLVNMGVWPSASCLNCSVFWCEKARPPWRRKRISRFQWRKQSHLLWSHAFCKFRVIHVYCRKCCE